MKTNTMSFGWRWIVRLALLRRQLVVGLLILTTTVYAISIGFPILTQRAVDSMVSERDAVGFSVYLALALVALAVEAFLSNARQRFLVTLGTFIDERISNLFFVHVMRLRADRKVEGAGSISIYFQHIARIRGFVLSLVPRAVFDIGGAAAALLAMTFYSVTVATAALVVFVASAVLMRRQMIQLGAISIRQFEADGRRLSFLNENYNALDAIKTLAIEGRKQQQWRLLTKEFVDSVSQVFALSQTFSLSSLIATRALSLAVVAIGCYQISLGQKVLEPPYSSRGIKDWTKKSKNWGATFQEVSARD